MSSTHWLLIAGATILASYGAALLGLVVTGRRSDARAFARFVPDCGVLFARLLSDRRVPVWRKALLAAAVVYLAMPIDLVPDLIPVAGQLDDGIIVALVLRVVMRGLGESLLREHWPGPEQSLRVIRRLARGSTR